MLRIEVTSSGLVLEHAVFYKAKANKANLQQNS